MSGLVCEDCLGVVERVSECAHPQRLMSCREQPRGCRIRPLTVEPVTRDECGGRRRALKATGGVAVDGDALVRWDSVGQGLTNDFVAKPVPTVGDDEHSGG